MSVCAIPDVVAVIGPPPGKVAVSVSITDMLTPLCH
jgi:hypothetical protein